MWRRRRSGQRHDGGVDLRTAGARQGHAAAQVGDAGPVRRVLRRARGGVLRGRGPRRDAEAGRPRHHAGAGRRERTGRVRDRLAACTARRARPGRRPRQHRSGLRQERHDRGDLEGQQHHGRRRDEGQEGRRLVLRQRERALRGARQERDRSEVEGRRHDRQPAVRHEPVPEQGRRRRRGDDLQRARAGARDQEPGHGRALHARRPERDLDGGRRHGDARGRDLHAGRVDRGRGEPGHRQAVPEGELQGLGVLPRQPGRVPAARARQRPDARRGAPALAAERDQRADLARARGRCRRHGRGGVHAHRRHRQAVRRDQGRRRRATPIAPTSPRRPSRS